MQVLGLFIIETGTVQIDVGIGLKILGIVVAPSLPMPFASLADKAVAVNLGAHEVGSRNQNRTDQQGDDDGREFRLVGGNVVGNERCQYQSEDERFKDHKKNTGDPKGQARRLAASLFYFIKVIRTLIIECGILIYSRIVAIIVRAEITLYSIPSSASRIGALR
ncbi:MAG: hypothetical protein CFE50_06090 [Pseudomonas sp. PGPPP4]|nr:MAG: hypothetical protein CFE50_06090 [Pseudomonas sp. PGPPP4]